MGKSALTVQLGNSVLVPTSTVESPRMKIGTAAFALVWKKTMNNTTMEGNNSVDGEEMLLLVANAILDLVDVQFN